MTPQNLLILMSDEHNAAMLGAAGHGIVKTPHLDQLAARGTRFTDAYTTCAICVPARASFATGRYIHDIGYWDNSIAYDGRVPSWGHRLQSAGVRAESIGKLHYRRETDPTGFDHQYIPMHITDGVGMIQLSIRKQFPNYAPPPRKRSTIAEQSGPGESEYSRYDRRVADLAVDWLKSAAKTQQRWVLFVSFVTPHYPLVAPKEYFDLYKPDEMPLPKFWPGAADASGYKPHPWLADLIAGGPPTIEHQRVALAAYFGLISFMDAQVGRVLAALDAAGLSDTTRILYTSDHGENAGARGVWGKSNHYQDAVAIPMIIAGEGVPAGKTNATPVTLADAFPSVLDCAGVPLHADDKTLPGRSLFAIAKQPADRNRIAFSEYHAAASPSGAYMLRKGRYKLIYYVGYAAELFDLERDPEEARNLAGDPLFAAIKRELESELREIVDPEDADRRANAAQKALIDARGGPDAVMANLPTKKLYTPVPPDLLK